MKPSNTQLVWFLMTMITALSLFGPSDAFARDDRDQAKVSLPPGWTSVAAGVFKREHSDGIVEMRGFGRPGFEWAIANAERELANLRRQETTAESNQQNKDKIQAIRRNMEMFRKSLTDIEDAPKVRSIEELGFGQERWLLEVREPSVTQKITLYTCIGYLVASTYSHVARAQATVYCSAPIYIATVVSVSGDPNCDRYRYDSGTKTQSELRAYCIGDGYCEAEARMIIGMGSWQTVTAGPGCR